MERIELASFPLATLAERPSDWMLNLLADLYEAEIRGTHGLHIVHPRASWLTLVVSSVTTCEGCGDPARWEERGDDGGRVAWCGRCAEAEVALAAAALGVVSAAVAGYETEPTRVDPIVRMADLPRAGTLLCVMALALGLGSVGCATARPVVAVETVGQLSASSSHVYAAPVHASTDLSGGFQAVDADEDAPAVAALNPSEIPNGSILPDVAAKTDGVTAGSVRP